MKNTMLKNLLKFIGAGLGMVALAVGAISGVQYLKYRYSPEYKAEAEVKNLIKAYEEDPYGGDTPEETLRLFVEALKKGDTDLAAKYFVMNKRDEWNKKLSTIKEEKMLNEMAKDLSRQKDRKETGTEITTFFIYNDSNQLALVIRMIKLPNKKWKIQDL